MFRRWVVIATTAVVGVVLAVVSWRLYETLPWFSGLLANVAATAVLIVPADVVIVALRKRVVQAEVRATNAAATAVEAQMSATETARSLDAVRQALLDRQSAELVQDLDVYRSIVTHPSLASFVAVLRKAREDDLISDAGVRSPVWETDLHYRYQLDPTMKRVTVGVEEDDATVLWLSEWEEGLSAEDFFQRLIEAVRSLGRDLGTRLNDPTESVERLSEMLVQVAQLRAQVLAGHRETIRKVVEQVDGWFFTERYVIPKEQLHYAIEVSRLGELDWEKHLRDKGWYDAETLIPFARKLYSNTRGSEAGSPSIH